MSNRELGKYLGESFTRAAHWSGQNVTYIRHSTTYVGNRVILEIRTKYYGYWTGNRYDVTLTITLRNVKGVQQIEDIDYSDDNPHQPANWGNIARLKAKLNLLWSEE